MPRAATLRRSTINASVPKLRTSAARIGSKRGRTRIIVAWKNKPPHGPTEVSTHQNGGQENVRHSIDPGFVHVRKIETILGPGGMSIIDDQIRRLPPDLPDWQKSVRLDHIYTRTMLLWCQANEVASLRRLRAKRQGRIFCSNEEIGPARAIGEGRVSNQILLEDDCDERFEVHYSTRHLHGDTPRERLRDGGYTMSIIAELRQTNGNVVVFDPIVMGSPWLETDGSGPYHYQGID